jgi:NAD(P)-dependent dehydrogenase (short-subunit alcohol dehydrogenase family)
VVVEIDLTGRVAVVTGAGGGLGRSHALLLARRGANVVVNDVGDGAHTVVGEIVDAGGKAVANRASVADAGTAAGIVAEALEAFGRVDIVVNNAGIIRDRSFAKMTLDDLREVLDVHVFGAFHVTMAAWPHLREQGYGRVVNTVSGAGLFGNFGQANYATAKMGLVGFTRTLAAEGRKYGITVNAVSPIAASGMTETILPADVLAKVDPGHVSPVVAYLCSEACTETGVVVVAGGGYVARVAVLQGEGVVFDHVALPEEVADRWPDVMRLGNAMEFRDGAAEQAQCVLERLGREIQ